MSTPTRACAELPASGRPPVARRSTEDRGHIVMEFRCRLGTPGGEIIEGVYVADSEARLRREFEEKGCSSSRSSRAGRRALGRRWRCRGDADSDAASSWSSTRSWRRCSRPACRWCSRSTSCAAACRQSGLQVGARRRVRAGAGGQLVVGGVRGARGAVSRRLHRVAAGRREERQPRAGASAVTSPT